MKSVSIKPKYFPQYVHVFSPTRNVITQITNHMRSVYVISWPARPSPSTRDYLVPIARLHPRSTHLEADYVTTSHEGFPNSKTPSNAALKCGLLFPLFRGCIATILRGLPNPKILCAALFSAAKTQQWRHQQVKTFHSSVSIGLFYLIIFTYYYLYFY